MERQLTAFLPRLKSWVSCLMNYDIYDRLKKDRSITPEKLKEESVLKNGGSTLKEYIVQ